MPIRKPSPTWHAQMDTVFRQLLLQQPRSACHAFLVVSDVICQSAFSVLIYSENLSFKDSDIQALQEIRLTVGSGTEAQHLITE